MQKLNKQTVNAVAHNIILEDVLASAWDFVCNLAPSREFDYAFTNTASEDYMDTIWHTVQNVKLHDSLLQVDAEDMYNNALHLYKANFINQNLAEITVEEVYATLDDISGDTAMREEYYATLLHHFKQFVAKNPLFALEESEYKGCYKLVSKHTYADKKQLVSNYLNRYDAYEYVELNNSIA